MRRYFKITFSFLMILLVSFSTITPKISASSVPFRQYTYAFIDDRDLALVSQIVYGSLPLVDNPKEIKQDLKKYSDYVKNIYKGKAYSKDQLSNFANDYIPIKKISLPEGKTISGLAAYIFYNRSSNSFVIAIRGTEIKHWNDVQNCITLALSDKLPMQMVPLTSVVDYFFSELNDGKTSDAKKMLSVLKELGYKNGGSYLKHRYVFTGHSLGGYLAMLTAMHFMENERIAPADRIYMTSFNAPGAGNTKYYQDLKAKLKKQGKEQYANHFRYYVAAVYEKSLLSSKKTIYFDRIVGDKLVVEGRYGGGLDIRIVLANDKRVRFLDKFQRDFENDMCKKENGKTVCEYNMYGLLYISKLLKLHSIEQMVENMQYWVY